MSQWLVPAVRSVLQGWFGVYGGNAEPSGQRRPPSDAAGVDPAWNAPAGIGDHRNYELLVEAGLTAAEAIQVMSLNGARVLGIADRLGSIAVGKTADLAVIAGDPVAKSADIRKVTVVFRDGIGYDSARLYASVKGLVGIR